MAKKPEYNYKSLQTEYGKMPPQAVDLEEAILGSLMLEKDAFITVSDFLKPECFYKEAHQKIYRGIQNLSLNNEPVDILTVSEEMKRLGELEEIGGYYYLAQLTSKVASAARGAEIYSAGIDPGMYRYTEQGIRRGNRRGRLGGYGPKAGVRNCRGKYKKRDNGY